ncbi:MAG: hypothetical protein UY92_C0013G0003 [Candidatus Magasanikbacteria bacterium GW2011_GWA2_56_11]|uniref:Uncharacterized protein n=1 Tax=Candidatus Magasanikbacteria bacterium GW2011_GWA2_56_11 TaxID=1619044 RepID=A0A0G2B8M8_9BACT|nr:MAG: hypothetical protein UY92_C0013G0003 [Candidatus Magasanikbacteria bacterium GW2011_GWA2_56_11]
MFGFTRTKTSPVAGPEFAVEVETIPDIFYGGKDPEIYRQTPSAESGKRTGSVSSAAASGGKKLSPKLVITLLAVFFVLAVAGISWYYLRDYFFRRTPAPSVPAALPATTPAPALAEIPPATTTPEMPATELTPVPVTTTAALSEPPLEFPPLIRMETSDLDGDQLTDEEEELFGTDSGIWDTDSDGYYDGQELFNLYNPKGFAPVKLIDSGLVTEYVNPVSGYRVYYPLNWQLGIVDPAGSQVLLSASDGDYIEVRLSVKEPGEDFLAWFARRAPAERVTDLVPGVNRFGLSVQKRSDDMVVYLDAPGRVFVLIYHPRETAPVAYKHVIGVVAQSFRLGRESVDIPPPAPLPPLPASADASAAVSLPDALSPSETPASSTST